MQDTVGEAGTNSQVMFSNGPPHMAVQKQDDQHEHTFSNYVRIRDVVQKTCLRRWTIGKMAREGQRYPCYQHDMMMMMCSSPTSAFPLWDSNPTWWLTVPVSSLKPFQQICSVIALHKEADLFPINYVLHYSTEAAYQWNLIITVDCFHTSRSS